MYLARKINKMILKYPRTSHLKGSRKSGDDFELTDVPFEDIAGKFVIYETKVDGGQAAVSFEDNRMILQSRGHELRGGPREKEFVQFKIWANSLKNDLFDVLGNRYIMYGECSYAKHTVYYDNLPHYFLEFDVFDKEKNLFLSTMSRQKLLEGLDYVAVPIAYQGMATTLEHLKSFIGPSMYKTKEWKNNLIKTAENLGVDVELTLKQTDPSDLDEGIYIKVETETETIGRYKFVRESFVNEILNSGSHWHDRKIIPNKLGEKQ